MYKKTLITMGLFFLPFSIAAKKTHTDKNYMALRPQGVNLPLEMTTWYNQIAKDECPKPNGFHMGVAGFYQARIKNNGLKKYYSINGQLQNRLTTLRSDQAEYVDSRLDLFDVIHVPGIPPGAATGLYGDLFLTIDPQYRSWGATIFCHQNLSCILSGLYLRGNLPIVHTETAYNLRALSAKGPEVTKTVDDLLQQAIIGNNYGQGVPGGAIAPVQKQLQPPKVGRSGLADIDLALGYRFLNADSYKISAALAVTIPTGDRVNGDYWSPPTIGNGRHFGLGADFDASLCLFENSCHRMWMHAVIRYRYLFDSVEARLVGVKGIDKIGYTAARAGMNMVIVSDSISTLDLKVIPGSQLDSALSLAYEYKNFNFDLGYNLYYRQKESIKEVKKGYPTGIETLYVTARNWNTSVPFDPVEHTETVNGVPRPPLRTEDVDFHPVITPAQLVHGIFGGFGYVFRLCHADIMLGIGGKYEWASANSTPETWSVWGKYGVSF